MQLKESGTTSEESSSIQFSKLSSIDVMDRPFLCSRVVAATAAVDYSNFIGMFSDTVPSFPVCKSSANVDINFLLQADEFINNARKQNTFIRMSWTWS